MIAKLLAFLAWSLSARLAILFIAGLFAGSAVNWAVYRFAWNQRAIGPWSPRMDGAKLRGWFDWLPVVGWLGMRRDAALHGSGFWIRPMLLELATACGFVAIYWWETEIGGLLPEYFRFYAAIAPLRTTVHLECLSHLVLFTLMMAATWIDIDEKTIPDAITLPGTLLGLVIVTWLPRALLPSEYTMPDGSRHPETVWLFSPLHLGDGHILAMPALGRKALVIALACVWFWVFAMLPRSWYTRHGYVRAVRLMVARLVRHWETYFLLFLGLAGTLAVVYFWSNGQDINNLDGLERWLGLLSSLVGIGIGICLVWIVRALGTWALQREAMGFGDVTLMAMIGAYLGWQPVVLIFFLAPFVAIVIGLAQFLWRGEVEIAYGPFLCVAAMGTIIGWATVWDFMSEYFRLGWLVPVILLVCLSMIVVLLPLVRLLLDGLNWVAGRRGD